MRLTAWVFQQERHDTRGLQLDTQDAESPTDRATESARPNIERSFVKHRLKNNARLLRRGFTLLEMMIAITCTASLVGAVTAMLVAVLRTSENGRQHAIRQREIARLAENSARTWPRPRVASRPIPRIRRPEWFCVARAHGASNIFQLATN